MIITGEMELEEKVKDLKDPSDREWTKAKSLILLLSGITGLVMISAITFFIVMSVTISQKVAELDRVMLAVAKRGMQLGDGIESIVEMESKLLEIIEVILHAKVAKIVVKDDVEAFYLFERTYKPYQQNHFHRCLLYKSPSQR